MTDLDRIDGLIAALVEKWGSAVLYDVELKPEVAKEILVLSDCVSAGLTAYLLCNHTEVITGGFDG